MDPLPEIADFEIISCLGYGARSTIYAVSEKKSGQVYALKRVVRKSADDDRFIEQAEQEFAIASQFDHPSLRKSIRMIRRRKMLKTAELYLLMELFDGQSLDVQRPEKLSSLIKIFVQVAQGLAAMHRLGYVHADIKPNNILVNDKFVTKIIDFGQSCSIGTVKTRIQGTPDYIAPEQVGRGPLTPATDVFNFGATMYWCCTDHHIPTLIPKKKDKSSVPTAPVNENREPKAPHELNPQIPMPLSRVIMDCVQNRPSHRPQDFTAVIPRLELALTVAHVEGPLKRLSKESLMIPESRDESKDDQMFE
ncbi:MAG: serine/threonine protein kinase [Phycisphaerae bacterium]